MAPPFGAEIRQNALHLTDKIASQQLNTEGYFVTTYNPNLKPMTPVSTQKWFFAIALFFLVIQTIFTFFWRTPSVEMPFHDTYFVVSNSQILMSVSAFFAFIGIIYLVFGRMNVRLHTGLNRVHIIGSVAAILVLVTGLVTSGFFTVSKSTNVNAVLFDYKWLNKTIALSGFLLLFAQIVFILNCINGIFRLRKY